MRCSSPCGGALRAPYSPPRWCVVRGGGRMGAKMGCDRRRGTPRVGPMRRLPAPEPREPESRSAARYLFWAWREQWRSQLTGFFWGISWMLSLALMPAVIGRAIDRGLLHRSSSGLLLWSGTVILLAAVTAFAGGMRHRS